MAADHQTPPASKAAAEAMAAAVRAAMAARGLNQTELAELAQVSAFTIRRLRNAYPGPYWKAKLRKVALALGWPADRVIELLEGQDAPAEVDIATQLAELREGQGELARGQDALATRLDEIAATIEQALQRQAG